ncbi:MAG: peptide chain release factor N(5)-glutamine methyltransferase [Oscillospiraceae bacterium]|nr:peptide chain release factor N(5)-glutamine methyltransferase [Oscillospiraceae bacterium]
MRNRDLYVSVKQMLKLAHIESPGFEANVIFEEVLGKMWMLNVNLTKKQAMAIYSMAKRRVIREPLQYIIGNWFFCGLNFFVGPGVLVPRPETETLVEVALKIIETKERPVVFDLCSGSGCIGISVAMARPDAIVYLVEKSKEAFEYLKKNCEVYKLENANSLNQDIFDLLPDVEIDLIVANPPYVKTAEIGNLQKEVLFEPRIALDGGVHGLDFYPKIAKHFKGYLKPRGTLALEVGFGQMEAVLNILGEADFKTAIEKDLNGIERVAIGQLDDLWRN